MVMSIAKLSDERIGRRLRLRDVKSAHHQRNSGEIPRREIAPRRHCGPRAAVPK